MSNSNSENPRWRNRKTTRNYLIDALKGLCIISVLITHLPWNEQQLTAPVFPYWISMAVPIFMILSGYLSALSMQRNGTETLEISYRPKRIAKTILRFSIPYVIFFLGEVLYNYYTKSLTQSSVFKFFLTGGIGPGSYYYPVMIQFVFLFPLIYFIIKDRPVRGLAVCFFANLCYEILKTAYFMNPECYRLLVFRYIFAIAIGVFFAQYKKPLPWYILIASLAIGGGALYLSEYRGVYPDFLESWHGTNLPSFFWAAPIAYGVIRLSRKVNGRWLAPLAIFGRGSFNIFLFQMLYFAVISEKVAAWIPNVSLAYLVHVLICLACGMIFYAVEMPVTRFINRQIDRIGALKQNKTAELKQ